jgi:ribosomal peptide maturation radical SAM protein 1
MDIKPDAPLPLPADPPFRVALIAMPWAIFNRPSIQLGALKAYLETETDWIKVDALHPYLDVATALGSQIYHTISQNLWLSEALYGILLFPQNAKKIEKVVNKALRSVTKRIRNEFNLEKTLDILRIQLDSLTAMLHGKSYNLVGFSVCFHQLLASLAAAAALKTSNPRLPLVFGGSSCVGDLGLTLKKNFPQINHIITGEGELPLLQLCRTLAFEQQQRSSTPATKIDSHRHESGQEHLVTLNALPIPDYSDYFLQMRKLSADRPFIPRIPVEFSRGCWWGKCTFCNLNLQWTGFRKKLPRQMLHEITDLADRHECLDFVFADNSLPVQESMIFFHDTAHQPCDYRFFGEVRALVHQKKRQQLFAAYFQGGLTTIQVGIEALSNSLLTRMNKGCTVLDNIAIMRDAIDNGLTLEGNLITEFPGSTNREVEETLANLEFLLPYHPLSTATFFLGYGSPIAENPQRYAIQTILHHWANRQIFPKAILQSLRLLIMDYRGDRLEQKKRWRPVTARVKAWKDFHRKRACADYNQPPLSYRDGGSYIIIRQEKIDRPTLYHRLRKRSRDIYLFCGTIRHRQEIEARFPDISPNQLSAFLDDLVDKHILFREEDRFLSLAVACKNNR